MPHIIEVSSQVKIDDARFSLINRLSHSVYRFMRCPFYSVSIRPRLEISFEDRSPLSLVLRTRTGNRFPVSKYPSEAMSLPLPLPQDLKGGNSPQSRIGRIP